MTLKLKLLMTLSTLHWMVSNNDNNATGLDATNCGPSSALLSIIHLVSNFDQTHSLNSSGQ